MPHASCISSHPITIHPLNFNTTPSHKVGPTAAASKTCALSDTTQGPKFDPQEQAHLQPHIGIYTLAYLSFFPPPFPTPTNETKSTPAATSLGFTLWRTGFVLFEESFPTPTRYCLFPVPVEALRLTRRGVGSGSGGTILPHTVCNLVSAFRSRSGRGEGC